MKQNILVIDDDKNIREVVKLYLRKEGYEVKNRDFLRVGLPFTLVAVLVGYAYIWLVWA